MSRVFDAKREAMDNHDGPGANPPPAEIAMPQKIIFKPLTHFGTVTLAGQVLLDKLEKVFAGKVEWWHVGDANRPVRVSWRNTHDEHGFLHEGAVTMPHCLGKLVTARVRPIEVAGFNIYTHRAYLPIHATVHRPNHTTLEFRYYPNGLHLLNREVCHAGDHVPEWTADAQVYPVLPKTQKGRPVPAAGQMQPA